MNKIYLAIMALLALASCTSLDDEFRLDDNQKQPSRYSEIQRYQVPLASARYFAQKLKLEDHALRQIKSIEPIIKGQDTLMYFVNYEGDKGWVVLSGDKRTEAILASSTKGYIDKEVLGGSSLWFEDLAGKIYGLKHSKSKDTQSGDYAMWCKIDTLALGLHPSPKGQRLRSFAKEPGDDNYDNDERDYEDFLVDTQIEVLVDKAVGPLIATKWGQGSPWNICTPSWRETSKRCPVGCVAVAGAQMLYYFHFFKNKPQGFYSRGWCTGSVWDNHNRSYSFYFDSMRPDTWDKMAPWSYSTTPTEATNLAGILMGFVGFYVDMNYGEIESGAYTNKLMEVYQMFDIRSEYAAYNPDLVRSSLDKLLPVNIRAYAGRKMRKILIFDAGWHYYNGHSWIIDGYRDKCIRYTSTYERLPKFKKGGNDEIRSIGNEPRYSSMRHQPTYGKYTITEVQKSYFWKMNFGWSGSHDTGDYMTQEDDVWQTSQGNYAYKKEIIHNFSF